MIASVTVEHSVKGYADCKETADGWRCFARIHEGGGRCDGLVYPVVGNRCGRCGSVVVWVEDVIERKDAA